MNMRQLLEQQEKRKEQLKATPEAAPDNSLLSAADELFLRKALKFVEQNLDNPEYSVEVLSRDMGMDRTGLYRKLGFSGRKDTDKFYPFHSSETCRTTFGRRTYGGRSC